MSRVVIFAHYTPIAASEMSAGCSEKSLAENVPEQTYEVEVYKSQIVTVASCGVTEDRGSVENIRYKSCGGPTVRFDSEVTAISEDSEGAAEQESENSTVVKGSSENKPRRFKRISLPQWLLKPSKKSSHNSTRLRRVSGHGKRRILRTYSAPKTLGSNSHFHFDEGAKPPNGYASSAVKDAPQKGSQPDLTPLKEKRRARRISLPVGFSTNVGTTDTKDLDARKTRTPDLTRKSIDEVKRTIHISSHGKEDFVPNKPALNQTTADIENPENLLEGKTSATSCEEKTMATREAMATRETVSQLKNSKKEGSCRASAPSRLSLKLHKFHNPDIFYVPLPNDESQSPDELSKKLCRARLIEPKNENYLIQERAREELESFLRDKPFCGRSCQQWCLELSNSIKTRAQRVKNCQCKIVCVVYIGALRGNGVHAAVQCLWTPSEDNFITVHYKNRSLLAVASVLAITYS